MGNGEQETFGARLPTPTPSTIAVPVPVAVPLSLLRLVSLGGFIRLLLVLFIPLL